MGKNSINKDEGSYKLDNLYDQLILNWHDVTP